jgi:isochorismate synthase EntC
VLHDGVWRLFAGAGIVEGSVPSLEWEETAMKFTPVLEALAASGVELAEAEGPRPVETAS